MSLKPKPPLRIVPGPAKQIIVTNPKTGKPEVVPSKRTHRSTTTVNPYPLQTDDPSSQS